VTAPRGAEANLAFLAAALRGETQAPAVDPAGLDRFARRNKVGEILDSLLEASPLREALPEETLAGFRALRLDQTRRSDRLLAALRRIAAAFRAAHVDFVALKGLGLANRFHGGFDRRATRDLDLLVRREDLAAAEGVLQGLGYRRVSKAPLRALALRFAHAFEYESPEAAVDLHWALARHPSYRFDVPGLWARRGTRAIGDVRVDELSDEDGIAFCAVSILKDLQRGALRLRALVDLYRMAATARLDWAAFLERRRAEGTYAITVNVLALLLEAFDARAALPAVAAAVDAAGAAVLILPGAHLRLLAPGPLALRNRFLALRLYDCSPFLSLAWWLASMPVRLLAYRSWRPARRHLGPAPRG
jgi:hypothetical protein